MADYRDRFEALSGGSFLQCPHCETGILHPYPHLRAGSGHVITKNWYQET